jgi:hypothetical protein
MKILEACPELLVLRLENGAHIHIREKSDGTLFISDHTSAYIKVISSAIQLEIAPPLGAPKKLRRGY